MTVGELDTTYTKAEGQCTNIKERERESKRKRNFGREIVHKGSKDTERERKKNKGGKGDTDGQNRETEGCIKCGRILP